MKKSNLLSLGVLSVLCLAGCAGGGGSPFGSSDCDDERFECKVNGVSVDIRDSAGWLSDDGIRIYGYAEEGTSNCLDSEGIGIHIPGETLEAIPITIPIGDYDEPTRTAGGTYQPGEHGWGVIVESHKCGGITGYITVTRLDEDRFEGTFSFRACQLNNGGAVVDVTDGRFSTCGW